jgi:hypothetical protein
MVAATPGGANSVPAPCPAPPAYQANYLTTLNPDTGQVTPVTVVGAALGTSRWSSCPGRAPKLLRPALLSFDQPSGALVREDKSPPALAPSAGGHAVTRKKGARLWGS